MRRRIESSPESLSRSSGASLSRRARSSALHLSGVVHGPDDAVYEIHSLLFLERERARSEPAEDTDLIAAFVHGAIAVQAHGGLDQLKLHTDWPEPTAGPGQAVVSVKACGLNYLDIFVLQGMPGLPVAMPRIPGGDIAGVVHSVGAGVGREWVGRRVLIDPHIKPGGALGEHANGGLCEQIVSAQILAVL